MFRRIKKYYNKLCHYWMTPSMVDSTALAKENNWIDMYYMDVLPLDFDADSVDNEDWVVENNSLRLKQPEQLQKTTYALTLYFTGNELVHGKYPMPVKTRYYLNIRVRTWRVDEFRLKKVGRDWAAPQYVHSWDDDGILFRRNYLYYFKSGERPQRMCKMCIKYLGGLEIVRSGEWYALRNGTQILLSNGLQGPWKVIFDKSDATGIRHSMVFVKNEQNEDELLFCEYTTSWGQHNIYCYNIQQDQLTIRQTFYSIEEHNKQGLEPFARHTHLMVQDPCSGYIFIGNGDYNDGSSAIYYSKDHCQTLIRIGSYSQEYRTLAFIFTEKSIFWNMDTPYEPQYICRLSREDLPEADVKKSPIKKFPLIQSAHWLIEPMQTPDGETMYVMATNREAKFYDERVHTFGIKIENEEPMFYELLALPYDGDIFYQYDPLGVKDNLLLMEDTSTGKRAYYELEKIN